MQTQFDEYRFNIPYKDICSIVEDIRFKLYKKYRVNEKDSKYPNYRGLCDIATKNFISELHKRKNPPEAWAIHGEQKHTFEIYPPNWAIQHTWCMLDDGMNILYVDLTSQQFQWLYKDIPAYYVSNKAPRWYFPDQDNPYFRYYNKKPYLSKAYAFYDRLKSALYMIIWDLK